MPPSIFSCTPNKSNQINIRLLLSPWFDDKSNLGPKQLGTETSASFWDIPIQLESVFRSSIAVNKREKKILY